MAGRRAVVLGRSDIVGKPMALLLLHADATVTVCHSRTAGLASVTREADILIAAIGRPGFVRAEHVGPGAVVVDVGINRVESRRRPRTSWTPAGWRDSTRRATRWSATFIRRWPAWRRRSPPFPGASGR